MSTWISIVSARPLGGFRTQLEDDLDDLLGEAGEVIEGSTGDEGWNIDLELFDDAALASWVDRLVQFLRRWPVPDDTFLKVLFLGRPTEGEPGRVDVFPPGGPVRLWHEAEEPPEPPPQG